MAGDNDESSPCTLPACTYSGTGNIRTRALQREQIMSNFKTMKERINDLNNMSTFQLEVKLSLLERQLESFEKIQLELEMLDESEISQSHRCTVEDDYCNIKSVILERLALYRGNGSEMPLSGTRIITQPISSQRPVLPTLQLSKFSGNFKDWMEFYNMFCLLVHENQELSPVSKFQYLKSCLQDSAARLIQALEVTAENYSVALGLLESRYNNKRHLFQSHLLELFNIQRVNKPSVTVLRLFIDNVNASMRALESIATTKQIADSIILHLIISKLDPDLQAKWEDSQIGSSSTIASASTFMVPSWEDLSTFLERRCKSLEIYENSPITPNRCPRQNSRHLQHNSNRSFVSNPQTASYVSSNQESKCVVCDSSPSHSLFRCTEFVDMDVPDRFKLVKRLKLCLNCLGVSHIASSCPSLNRCQKCNATHHTLLHKETQSLEEATQTEVHSEDSSNISCLQVAEENSPIILATAMIELCSPSGTTMMVRALLDSCSQSNFITERMAQRLRLTRRKININICGIGGTSSVCAKYACSFTARSLTSGYAPTLDAIVISSISSWHPQHYVNVSEWNIPANVKLADKHFNVPGPVDLLLGVDLFWDILMVGRIKVKNQPNLIKTKLGWVVSGSTAKIDSSSNQIETQIVSQPMNEQRSTVLIAENSNNVCSPQTKPIKYTWQVLAPNEPLLENLLQSFWNIENLETSKRETLSTEEAACEQFFKETTKRCPITNKFIVRLPFKVVPPDLGKSRPIAQRRFAYLEARFARNKCIHKEYIEFLDEYRSLDHMRPIATDNSRYFIPHHCVVKPESSTTRLRVVFDASCTTTNGNSLNDQLYVGPTLQDDIFTILIRFRYHKFVLVADIAKMYRQILVDEDDKKWQCILWRKNVNDPLLTYELQTVTYGTSCAPYLAVKCLQQLAKEETSNYPLGATVTLRDFYVDNLMTGGNSEAEVIEIKRQVTALLKMGGFPLRKFASNSDLILRDVPQSERETVVMVEDIQYIKTLGLKWSPSDDTFNFSYPLQQQKQNVTKRSILSHMASFFDPIGFINPLIVRCKILMQHLWKLKLQWDESVPFDVFSEWERICNELKLINQIKIPRYVNFNTTTNVHLFVDASQRAYGACIYAVTKDDNYRNSNLICAKSRVAPSKEISLPRLELCAALLGSQLLTSIRDKFPITPNKIVCSSDSTITLSWIAGEACRWPTFIANRVTKIKHLSKGCTWRHVPSELNSADLLSRGTSVTELSKPFWLKGPEFLLLEEENWPYEHQSFVKPAGKQINTTTTLIAVEVVDIVSEHKYVNNYEKLIRIFSYVKKFINICKNHNSLHCSNRVDDLNESLLLICRLIQRKTFCEEIKCLINNKPLNHNSKLLQLSPFLTNGVLRVGGRLRNSSLPFSTKHPILLPSSHPFVNTIIAYYHRKNLHAGSLTLHNILRDNFWIINGRNVIKKVVHNCILCYRCRPVTETQVMGSLPVHRVEQSFPFSITGVDYCGPFSVSSQIRGRGPKKIDLAIFICFSVKAVHVELVNDLTTAAFISALKRFISRRGRCSVIYSDNATNFIGANRELRNLLQCFLTESHNEMVQEVCRQEGITWKYIPPRSPHFGGLWESAVKQAKHYLRRSVGNLVLTYDDLHTVCCQIEAIINSRPLTPLSSDPSDLRPLTPAHFLVGRLLTTIPEPTVLTYNPTSLKRYQVIQWIQQQFWERWRNEYLKILQTKTKWTTTKANLKVDDLVLLKEDNTPPLKWPLARVVECNPGNDGVVRVVTVKTTDGTFKRAITKICKLPVEQ